MDNLKKFNAMEGNRSKELAMQHARLIEKTEQLPPGTVVAPEVTAEIKRLQAELYERLYSYMRGQVLPVLVPAPSKRDLEFIDHQKIVRKQIEGPLPPQIPFNFEVFSSVNTRIDRFKVPAATKAEAWKEAREREKKYPGRVKIKIS